MDYDLPLQVRSLSSNVVNELPVSHCLSCVGFHPSPSFLTFSRFFNAPPLDPASFLFSETVSMFFLPLYSF